MSLTIAGAEVRSTACWKPVSCFLRRRLTAESEGEFSVFPELRAAGMTDYTAIINRFADDGVIGHMDCVYSSWVTDAPGGFCDADLLGLQYLMPFLALAVKSAALGRIAENLVETYLGRDAGRRVLKGGITRGVAERIDAVLWFSDLRGFTRITDTAPELVIPMLDDYFDAIVSAIYERGGDVLKLIGDGVLAIFTAEDRRQAVSPRWRPRSSRSSALRCSTNAALRRACRQPTLISDFTSVMSSTATSAARRAWISRSSARPLTR